jgi:hypothetical protein
VIGEQLQVTEILRERHLAVAFLIALVSAMPFAASGQVQPTLVGILEDNPGHYAGNPHYRDVRVIFRKEKAGWVAFPSNCPEQSCLKAVAAKFPAQVNWTVSFDGKQVGQVVGRTPQSFDFYSTVGQQNIRLRRRLVSPPQSSLATPVSPFIDR